MSNASALDLKSQAAAAWERGDFTAAVDLYSEAIASVPVDGAAARTSTETKELLRVLYSNRSAAYLKTGRTAAALTDACKCIEVDAQWPKGYARKGDANHALGKYTEAYNAYNAGLRIAPSDASLKEKAELAMSAMRAQSDGNSSSNSSSRANGSGSAVPSNISAKLVSIQALCKVLVLLGAVVYCVPFTGRLSGTAYKVYSLAALSDYAIALYAAHGMPQMNMGYAQRVLPDPSTMYLFLAFILLMGRPYMFALLPILLVETAQLAKYVQEMGRPRFGTVIDKTMPLIDKFVPKVLAISNWDSLGATSRWGEVNSKVLQLSSSAEVFQGLFLVFELVLLPSRNMIYTLLWWQFLQMRYMLDNAGNTKRAFQTVDVRIQSLLAHRLCPSLLRTGYAYLKTFLSKQVQPPSETAAAGGSPMGGLMQQVAGMASKCTIC